MPGRSTRTGDALTVEALVSQVGGKRETKASMTVAVGGVQIEVQSDSALLVDLLADYYRPFLTEGGDPDILVTALEGPEFTPPFCLLEKTPDPGKTRVKEEYADLPDGRLVRKRLTGMVFFMGRSVNLAVGPCTANVNQIVNFVNSRYIQLLLRRGGLLCHASAVARGRRSVVIAGQPGAGKSTLALRLMDHGFDFVSNDRLVLTRDNRMTRVRGIPKLPRVNPGTIVGQARLRPMMSPEDLAEAEALATDELWHMERKYDVSLEEVYGPGRFHLEADLAGLVVLYWRPGGGDCHIEQFDPEQEPSLLGPLVKHPGLFYLPDTKPSVEAPEPDLGKEVVRFSWAAGLGTDIASIDPTEYARALVGQPALRISGGVDFEVVAEACSELLGRP